MLLAMCLSKEVISHHVTMVLHRFQALSSISPSIGLGELPSTKHILVLASGLMIIDLFRSLKQVLSKTLKPAYYWLNLRGVDNTYYKDFGLDMQLLL